MSSGLEDSSLFDLFRLEAEEQVRVLQCDLMLLEREGASATRLAGVKRSSPYRIIEWLQSSIRTVAHELWYSPCSTIRSSCVT